MIETVDMGAYEAMEAMGAGKAYSFISAIIRRYCRHICQSVYSALREMSAMQRS